MALLADDQTKARLEAARRSKTYHSEYVKAISLGKRSLEDALNDDGMQRVRVRRLLLAVPGIGMVKAKRILEQLGIDWDSRVSKLGSNQRNAIVILARKAAGDVDD